MFVVYLGAAGKQPLQGYAVPPNSVIIFNQLIYLYAMVVNLEMGNKYHIIYVVFSIFILFWGGTWFFNK